MTRRLPSTRPGAAALNAVTTLIAVAAAALVLSGSVVAASGSGDDPFLWPPSDVTTVSELHNLTAENLPDPLAFRIGGGHLETIHAEKRSDQDFKVDIQYKNGTNTTFRVQPTGPAGESGIDHTLPPGRVPTGARVSDALGYQLVVFSSSGFKGLAPEPPENGTGNGSAEPGPLERRARAVFDAFGLPVPPEGETHDDETGVHIIRREEAGEPLAGTPPDSAQLTGDRVCAESSSGDPSDCEPFYRFPVPWTGPVVHLESRVLYREEPLQHDRYLNRAYLAFSEEGNDTVPRVLVTNPWLDHQAVDFMDPRNASPLVLDWVEDSRYRWINHTGYPPLHGPGFEIALPSERHLRPASFQYSWSVSLLNETGTRYRGDVLQDAETGEIIGSDLRVKEPAVEPGVETPGFSGVAAAAGLVLGAGLVAVRRRR